MLQRTLRTKVHLLQAPRISIRTFRSSTRKLPLIALIAKTLTALGLNTNEFSDVFATKINKIEADVNGLKGDVSALRTDIRELGVRLERSMTERLGGHALNQEKKITELYFHSICAVSLTLYIVYQFLTRLRSWVLQYC